MRCEDHGLACGPDGRCVVCRRVPGAPPPQDNAGEAPPISTSRLWLVLGAALSIGGLASVARIHSQWGLSHPRTTTADVTAAADVAGEADVVIYTTDWCPVCKRAKAWMQARGIPYEERDVERSREYGRAMHAINPRGSVPTFDVGGEVLVGFSEGRLLAAMDRASAAKHR